MRNNRLLVIALILIAFGMAGIILTSQSGCEMRPMMMGGGKMHSNEPMKEMMQEMMRGRLPEGIQRETLPKPDDPGAKLLIRYCGQCHNLPSPSYAHRRRMAGG